MRLAPYGALRLSGGKSIRKDSIEWVQLADNGIAGSDERRAPRTLTIIEPTLPERDPAQARSLTSRSRVRPALSASQSWSFGYQGKTNLRTNPMITNTGLQTIELARGDPGETDEARPSRHGGLRHALAAERVRIRHMCKALACTNDASLRQRWQSEMADSLTRVREIEQALRSGMSQAEQHAADMVDECLLAAMELARANGDSRAAETVAMECMALVELRCMRIQQGHVVMGATLESEDGGIHYTEQSSHEKYQ